LGSFYQIAEWWRDIMFYLFSGDQNLSLVIRTWPATGSDTPKNRAAMAKTIK
jgi:hypothetical protein